MLIPRARASRECAACASHVMHVVMLRPLDQERLLSDFNFADGTQLARDHVLQGDFNILSLRYQALQATWAD